ncbi:MAG: SpoIIE family protein phosphatase [Calditrichia bacterium]|nr:SpoIIE family protein phosphatase [Calditrichia bacterium]
MPLINEAVLENIFSGLSFIMLKPENKVVYISEGFIKAFSYKEFTNDFSGDFNSLINKIGIKTEKVKEEIFERINKGLDYFIEIENECLYFLPIVFNKEQVSVIEIVNSPADKSVFHNLKQKDELLQIITNIFEGLVENHDIGELLQLTVQKLNDSKFPFYHVSIFLLDDSKEYVYLAAIEGGNKEFYVDKFPDGYFQKVNVGIIGNVICTKNKRIAVDVNKDPDYHEIENSPTITEICVPILFRDEIYGVINVESKILYKPGESEIKILENVAHYLAMAINTQMLLYEIERKQDEKEQYIAELQESKERVENQTFDIIENMEKIEQARKIIEKQNQRIQSELEIAGSLLKKLLPVTPEIPCIDFGIWFEPSASLGGDFYDFRVFEGNSLLFIQVDVTGHGVSSALLAAQSKIAFQNAADRFKSPGKLLEDLNNEFKNLNDTDLFFSAFAGYIDIKNRVLHYSNAAHPFPLLFKKNEVIELDTGGFLIGVLPVMEYEDKSIDLEENDVLVVYTDGLTEARNEKDEMYNTGGLKNFINKYKDKIEMNELLENLIQDIKEFSNDFVDDDLTILTFKMGKAKTDLVK